MNPASLTLPELRSLRTDLQNEEDAVSFVRRLAQGRLDVVREEKQKRGAGKSLDARPEQLAAVLAIIRPAKRYLLNSDWKDIMSQVWTKPVDDSYYFKKSHATSYAMAVVVHMNLICESTLDTHEKI